MHPFLICYYGLRCLLIGSVLCLAKPQWIGSLFGEQSGCSQNNSRYACRGYRVKASL